MTDDELAEKASRIISDMCKGGRWRMCIPVQSDDSDIVLSRVVRRFNELRASSPSRDSGALPDFTTLVRRVANSRTAFRESPASAALLAAISTLERDAARMREALAFIANVESRETRGMTAAESDAYLLGLSVGRASVALTPSVEPTTTPETSE